MVYKLWHTGLPDAISWSRVLCSIMFLSAAILLLTQYTEHPKVSFRKLRGFRESDVDNRFKGRGLSEGNIAYLDQTLRDSSIMQGAVQRVNTSSLTKHTQKLYYGNDHDLNAMLRIPTGEQLHTMEQQHPEDFVERGHFFMILISCLIGANIVVLETLRLIVYAYKSSREGSTVEHGYSPLRGSIALPEGLHSDEVARTAPVGEVEKELKYHDTDLFFAYFQASYQHFCLFLVLFSYFTGEIDQTTGMPWELIVIWVAFIMLTHWISAFYIFWVAGAEEIKNSWATVIARSVVPSLSEPCTDFKDFISAGILLAHNSALSVGLGTVLIGTTYLPNYIVYRDLLILKVMKQGYLPLLSTLDAQVGQSSNSVEDKNLRAKVWDKVLNLLDDMSKPMKRIIAMFEEAPQTVAGVIFTCIHGGSAFIIVNVAISLLSLFLVIVGRPYIMCWLAEAKRPWFGQTPNDVFNAILCRYGTDVTTRVRAANEVLHEESTPVEVMTATVEALTVLIKRLKKESRGGEMDPETKQSLTDSLALLLTSNERVVDLVKIALVELGYTEAEIADRTEVMIQIPNLQARSLEVQAAAAKELAHVGKAAALALPYVRELLRTSTDMHVLARSAQAVKNMELPPDDEIDQELLQARRFLMEILKDDEKKYDIHDRADAASYLAKCSKLGEPMVLRALKDEVGNKNPILREAAYDSLQSMLREEMKLDSKAHGGDESIFEIIDIMDRNFDNTDLRSQKTTELAQVVKQGNLPAISALMRRVVADTVALVQEAAIQGLRSIADANDMAVVKVLKDAINTSDLALVKSTAIEVTGLLCVKGEKKTLDRMRDWMTQEEDEAVRMEAARAIGRLSIEGDQLNIAALKMTVAVDVSPNVKQQACESLESVANRKHAEWRISNPDSEDLTPLPAFIQVLDKAAKIKAANRLDELASQGNQVAETVLLWWMREDLDWKLRGMVTEIVRKVARRGDPAVVASLLQVLRNESEASVTGKAADALGDVSEIADELVLEALRDILNLEAADVRAAAARAIEKLVTHGDEKCAECLLQRVLHDTGKDVRLQVMKALRKVADPHNTEILTVLLGCMNSEVEENEIRKVSVQILGDVAKEGDEELKKMAQNALLKTLASEDDRDVRLAVAEALEKCADENLLSTQVKVWLEKLNKYKDAPAERQKAIELLGQITNKKDSTYGEVTAVLKEHLVNDKAAKVRETAASSLGKISTCDKEMLEVLKDRLKSDTNEWVRKKIVEVLVRVADVTDQSVITALNDQMVKESSSNVRVQIAQAMGDFASIPTSSGERAEAQQFAIETVHHHLVHDNDKYVKMAAAQGLARTGAFSADDQKVLLKCLKEEEYIRGIAIEILGDVADPHDKEVAKLLRGREQKDGADWIREQAREALKKIQKRGEEASNGID